VLLLIISWCFIIQYVDIPIDCIFQDCWYAIFWLIIWSNLLPFLLFTYFEYLTCHNSREIYGDTKSEIELKYFIPLLLIVWHKRSYSTGHFFVWSFLIGKMALQLQCTITFVKVKISARFFTTDQLGSIHPKISL